MESMVSLLNRNTSYQMESCFIESKFILSLSYQEENHCKSMFYFRCGIELTTDESFGCGVKTRIIFIAYNIFVEIEVIGNYFHCGYDYKPIAHLLKTHCDISLSERTLK